MPWSSVRHIRSASPPNLITWHIQSRGYSGLYRYRNDPQFPKELYHPSFSIAFRVQTSPEDTINVLRAQYAEPGTLVACWERMRAFSALPMDQQEFYENVLATTAAQHDTFQVKLGDIFYSSSKPSDPTVYIGCRMNPSPVLRILHTSIRRELDPIRMDMLEGRTPVNAKSIPYLAMSAGEGKPAKLSHRYDPSVNICNVPPFRMKQRLGEIRRQCKGRLGEVKVIGLTLGRDARKEHYKNAGNIPFTFFPFRDFVMDNGGKPEASQVTQQIRDINLDTGSPGTQHH